MSNPKPRLVKDYEQLSEHIQEQIKLTYPFGFTKYLVSFVNKDGRRISALPFETDEAYYLIRMTKQEARDIIEQDEDYDDEGYLREEIREEYEEKYTDTETEEGTDFE